MPRVVPWPSESPEPVETWEFVAAIGPFFTRWGLGAHSLLLSHRGIVSYPYTRRSVWKLALYMQTGLGSDPEGDLRVKAVLGAGDRSFLLHPGRKVYSIHNLQKIHVYRRHMQNEIWLVRTTGQADRFYIPFRHATESYRDALRSTYQEKYAETGFTSGRFAWLWN